MDIDLELSCSANSGELIGSIFPENFEFKIEKRKNSKTLFIRTANSKHHEKSLDACICEFLNELSPIKDKIIIGEMVLRAGIFFSTHEIAFLSISLPQNTVRLISEFHLSLDFNCYPCSE